MRGEREEDEITRVVYHLRSIIIHLFRSLFLPVPYPTLAASSRQPSPGAFASLFLGISVAMMLFGSVTFVIGFFLMPLVIGLVMFFYLFGMIHNLSELGRAILWPGYPPNPIASAVPVPEDGDVCESMELCS